MDFYVCFIRGPVASGKHTIGTRVVDPALIDRLRALVAGTGAHRH